MNAEILAIGDELTSGQRLDTNSQWLSDQLGDLGIRVLFHTTVADDLEADRLAFQLAAQRAEIVISTGGLGPTADDLTREALAAASGRPLVLDPVSLDHIRALFRSRRRAMPERNQVQAMFPEGSRPIPNPHGTAPGIELRVERTGRPPAWIFALPGVPAEMREMWFGTVRPQICRLLGASSQTIRHYRLKCFGVGESDLEQMLPDLIRRGREPTVGITVSRATITLRVTARSESEEKCRQLMQPTVETIRQCLGELVFGEEDDELQHAVLRALDARGQTLATAESISGGLLCRWLSEVPLPEQSAYLGGLVVRDERTLGSMAGQQDPPCPKGGMDRRETVEWLAQRCRERFGADYGLALGRLPDTLLPPADAPVKPASDYERVPVAIATATSVVSKWAPYSGHPDIRQARCAKHALDLLRKQLAKPPAQK